MHVMHAQSIIFIARTCDIDIGILSLPLSVTFRYYIEMA